MAEDDDKDKAEAFVQAALDMKDCLLEIRDALQSKGVPMEQCPPSMYSEAIHNLAVWVARASRDCWRDHEWHKDDKAVFSKCMYDSIQRYAGVAASNFDAGKKPPFDSKL